MRKTVAFARDRANIFFHILTQCNLKCSHCYINPGQHGRERLSLIQIQSWLRIFIARCPEANLVFLGGEPTLHPDLPAAVKAARAMGYASITIDTNGYLFNDILAHVTPGDVDFFSFSLDGPSAEVNDAIRGSGCFDNCTAGLQKAKALGFGVSLIYTVSSRNLVFLEQMVPLLTEWAVDHFFIQVIGIRGKSAVSGRSQSSLQLTRRQWLDVVPVVAEAAAAQGIQVTYPKVFLEPGEEFECAGRVADNYFIFPNGRVYRCPLCEDFPLHSFQIEEDILRQRPPINEHDLFQLTIDEGCVMNKLIQPANLVYDRQGVPRYQIACCLLKEHVAPGGAG
jgi:MoaA/NifB/PqqE/SkfB family radical SAM enzyme